MKIKSIENRIFKGFVQNLSVRGGDASYVVDGIAVSNCPACAVLDGT